MSFPGLFDDFTTNEGFVVPSGGAVFSPASLNPVAWYDFNDGSTQTLVSGKISSMTDKGSGAVVMTQGNATFRPTQVTSGGFSNRGYGSFTGSHPDFLVGGAAHTFIGGSGTVFTYAARFLGGSQARGCLIGRHSGVNPDTWLSSGDTGNTTKLMMWVNDTVGGSGAGALSTATPYDGTWHSVVGTWNAGVYNQWIDGVLDVGSPQTLLPASMPTPYSQTFEIGSVNTGSVLLFTGNIEYVMIFDKALSAANITALKNYGS